MEAMLPPDWDRRCGSKEVAENSDAGERTRSSKEDFALGPELPPRSRPSRSSTRLWAESRWALGVRRLLEEALDDIDLEAYWGVTEVLGAAKLVRMVLAMIEARLASGLVRWTLRVDEGEVVLDFMLAPALLQGCMEECQKATRSSDAAHAPRQD